jgi:transcriptional regulator GlxA family with amidase domain
MSAFRICAFAISSGRFDMLVSMSDKELKRLSVLQEICDQRITQSQAAELLHISERQITRLLQKSIKMVLQVWRMPVVVNLVIVAMMTC